MTFRTGKIDGVLQRELSMLRDGRGWLCELFREDELAGFQPAMAYLSATGPGVVRGPHEHRQQADCFCFLGTFELFLWDNRPQSPTYRVHERITAGGDRPMQVIVPPGVVHAYKNIGTEEGLVVNCPDRLYKGAGRAEEVDEIRHEDDPGSPFRVVRDEGG